MRGLLLFAVLFAPALSAQEKPSELIAIRAGRIYTVDGPPLHHGIILIRDGRIVEIRPGPELPRGATLIEADNEVVIPGLVDAQGSAVEAGREAEESIVTDVRAIDGYDFYASNWRLLSGGITTSSLSPGATRLVSGQGAVVKTAGRDVASRILKASSGLRVTLGEASKNPPMLYSPPTPPSADRPLLPARRQFPSSRMGEFAALRRAALKTSPWFLEAHNEDDIVKAVLLAAESGVALVLVDGDEAPQVADLLAARQVPVLFNAGYAPGRRNGVDGARPALEATGTLSGPAALQKAGVRFALIAPEEAASRDLLFIAAAALRNGLSESAALAAVTRSPAEILGVADRVGTIAKGRDADLVFLSADPFSPGAVVRRVMVDGAFVFERREADVQTYRAIRDSSGPGKDGLAIRNGRIVTVTQGVLPEGLLFIDGGKISYVGRGRPLPAGAKTIDATGLTVLPGFIDFGSQLGLHVDRTEQSLRKRGGDAVGTTTVAPPSTLVRAEDPVFRAAAASGVTAILLAPEGNGVCSVLKLNGATARESAALKFSATAGTAGYQQLKDSLAAGRKYHDDWEAFERAKREGGASRDPLSGTWKGTIEGGESKEEFTAELKLDGTKVSGSFQPARSGAAAETLEGSFEQGELKVERNPPGFKIELTLKLLAADHLKGSWRAMVQGQETKGTIECRREAPPVASKTELKEPRKDEAMEPYRKLFAKEIPALVVARDLPAMENATRAFKIDHGIDVVLSGAEEAALAGDAAFSRGASVALGPEFLKDRRGARINTAEALASQGVGIAFASGSSSGTAQLPLLAAFAVRHGLEPFDALKALTVNPARMLKLDGRLGAIERGRDADLVLFSGDPFAPSSRVRYVIIDGKIVYEAP